MRHVVYSLLLLLSLGSCASSGYQPAYIISEQVDEKQIPDTSHSTTEAKR